MTTEQAGAPSVGVIRCPFCAAASQAEMPVSACLYFYECPSCRRLLKPKSGDCCVFCSYGEHQCPPKASEGLAAGVVEGGATLRRRS
jgi:hypothetical protein